MPTVFIKNGFRFFFYSNENNEPYHVHVKKGDAEAKVWLAPVSLESSYGFVKQDILKIIDIAIDNEQIIKEAWDEFFKN